MTLADFRSDPAGAVRAINRWTDDRTRGLIPEIVTTDLVTPDTRLVLVNAVYLAAPWRRPFAAGGTTEQPFITGSGDRVSAPTMTGHADHWFADEVCEAARLDYLGDELAMAVVRPRRSVDEVLRAWTGGGLARLLTGWQPRPVNLALPRWSHAWRGGLEQPLTALGMPTAFTPDADLSGITAEEALLIGFVEHRATIAVDEAGTEAAAATAVGVEPTSAPAAEPRALRLDRDFLHVVHDVPAGVPLFIGVVDDPTQ